MGANFALKTALLFFMVGQCAHANFLEKCLALVGIDPPRPYVRRLISELPRSSGAITDRLLGVLASHGETITLSRYAPPEIRIDAVSTALIELFTRRRITPVSMLTQYVDAHPEARAILEPVLTALARRGISPTWTMGDSVTVSAQRIEIGVRVLSSRAPVLALLVTLEHELNHRRISATRLPGETREAFFHRWMEILERDELAAMDAGIRIALQIEQASLARAEEVLSDQSQVLLRLRRNPFRSPTRQRQAERELLLQWSDGYYPRVWNDYLTACWNSGQ